MADPPGDSIAYTPTLADVLSASRLAAKSPWRQAMFEATTFALSCVAAMTLGRPPSFVAAAGWTAGLAVAYGGLATLARRWWLAHRVTRLFRQHASLRESHRGRWDEAGLETEVAGIRTRFPWTDMVKRRENGDTVLLYRRDGGPLTVPKRVLSPAQLSSLRPFLDRIPSDRVWFRGGSAGKAP